MTTPFPWDNLFNPSLQEQTKKEIEERPFSELKAASLAVFKKFTNAKTSTVKQIIDGINELLSKHPDDIENIKAETIQRFQQQLVTSSTPVKSKKQSEDVNERIRISVKIDAYTHIKQQGVLFRIKEFCKYATEKYTIPMGACKELLKEVEESVNENKKIVKKTKDRDAWIQTQIDTLTSQLVNPSFSQPPSQPPSQLPSGVNTPDEIGEQEDLVSQLLLLKQPDDPVVLKEKATLSTMKANPRFVEYTNTTVTPVPNVAPNKEKYEIDIRSDAESSDSDIEDEEDEDILDLNAECFTKQTYDSVDELHDELKCDDGQVCDISTKDCVDKTDEMEVHTFGPSEYINTSNTNVELFTRLKEKFKQVQIHTPTTIHSNVLDIPSIDMEETPAHVSERISLSQYTETLSKLQNRSRLSIDQRFNDRTKARRDLIRKCLNL